VALLSDADIQSSRAALEILLTHSCTLTPMVDGAEDAHGDIPSVPGSPQTGVRCRFETVQRAVRDQTGVTLFSVPTLSVSATLAIAIGDQISAVTDQLGGTPPGAAGTFRVERVLDDTAGLGASLLPVFELRETVTTR
jgi:hypothetical protein